MSVSRVTLGQLFFPDAVKVPDNRWLDMQSNRPWVELKERLAKEVKGIPWGGVLHNIRERFEPLLDVGLPDILAGAWNKYRLLLKYLDKEKYPPEEVILVPLVDHTIQSEHHPHLELLIDEKSIGKIEFQITLSLTLEGFTLKIQDGKIKEILTGTCKGEGTIKCENAVLVERELAPIRLPGSIDLGEGLPIRFP